MMTSARALLVAAAKGAILACETGSTDEHFPRATSFLQMTLAAPDCQTLGERTRNAGRPQKRFTSVL
jgi:hypothetical protein